MNYLVNGIGFSLYVFPRFLRTFLQNFQNNYFSHICGFLNCIV